MNIFNLHIFNHVDYDGGNTSKESTPLEYKDLQEKRLE
jgi:hypothetical protein